MPLAQTTKISTVAAVRSHTCRKVGTRGDNLLGGVYGLVLPNRESNPRPRRRLLGLHTTVDYSCFHHHVLNNRRQMEGLKGPVTARTPLGFLPLASLSPTTTMGSKAFQRGVHDGYAPEIKELYNGNKAYIANISETNPGLLQSLADNGQSAFLLISLFQKSCSDLVSTEPPFMVVDCSDSRYTLFYFENV